MPQSESDKKLLELARDRFKQASNAETVIRQRALEDLRFRAGDQWPEEIRRQREQDKRPCLTLDRLGQFVRQVLNDGRQNRPSIHVNPVDDDGDPDTAEVIQGLIRHIEQDSGAADAYDVARDYQVSIGFGFFRIRADYCDPKSFDQDIRIEPIPNPFSVYIDPLAMKPDRRDMKWGFITDFISKEEFKREYPNAETDGMLDFASIGDHGPLWCTDDSVRVAEYFYIDYEEVELALLEDENGGKVVMPLSVVPEGVDILNKRKAQIPHVKWCKMNGAAVLEKRDLPGEEIPIFPVLGEELIIDGRRQLSGIVRTAKDAQQQYNFMASAETEAIALAPRAPWVMAEGQDEGHEMMWATANNRSYSALKYKPKSVGGELAPPPQRQVFEPAIQAISMARGQAAADMNAATGMYDAALGARSNETSGRAILARQREGDNANFHFTDNFNRALRRCGRVMLSWIPVYYDTARVVRIIGDEGDQETVQINQKFEEGGIQKIYDLTTGKYDVIITAGPSYATKRQEAAASMLDMIKAFPTIMPIAGDLLVQNMDWPGAKPLADRLKKALPPNLQEDDKKTPVPPAAMAMMQQQGQMIEQLTGVVNQQAEEINTKRMELESKERIANLQAQKDVLIAQAQIESKESIELLKTEISTTNSKIDRSMAMLDHFVNMSMQREQVLNADKPVGEEQTVSAGG